MDTTPLIRSRLLWTGSACFLVIGAAGSLYGPALPALARLNGVTPAEAGLIVSVHNVGGLTALLASAALGAVSARQAMALVLAGAGLIALALGWAATLLGAAILGAGYALVAAVLNRRFLTEMGPRGPAMVSFLNAVFGIGAVAAPLLLLAMGGAPALAYAVLAGAVLLMIPLASNEPAQPPAPPALALVLKRPAILMLGAMSIGFETSMVGLGPVALVAQGQSEAQAAGLAAGFFTAFLLARLSLMWIVARLEATRLLAVSLALCAVLALAAANLPPAALFVLCGGAVGLLFPAYYVAASAELGSGGRASAVILAAVYVGAIVMPALASWVIGSFGAERLFPFLALLAAAASLGAWLLAVRRGAV